MSLLQSFWVPVSASVLSGVAFCWAAISGMRLADVRDRRIMRGRESRMTLVFLVGVTFMLIAIALWIVYLIFGPVRDAASGLLLED